MFVLFIRQQLYLFVVLNDAAPDSFEIVRTGSPAARVLVSHDDIVRHQKRLTSSPALRMSFDEAGFNDSETLTVLEVHE